ncbi:Putative CscD cell-surface protein, LPxTG anchor [Latilactobacillus curvatus]|nr:Putative CscD cell-surface protein, LPxTG anchor [Latilactobacillus curvatus]
MKFTKLTSSVLAGATLLSILAPTATFAATSTAG